MKHNILAATLVACVSLSGCATYQAGSVSIADQLKRFEPVAGKASIYVCRVPAVLSARGVKTVSTWTTRRSARCARTVSCTPWSNPASTACCCATMA